MTHSDSLADLAEALAEAQAEFEAVAKSAANPFFKSSYAPLPEVVKAATPVLARHGLSVSQTVGFDGEHDTLTTKLLHKSGEYLADTMRLHLVKDDPQAHGSAITYGRRYAYMAILGLVADDDDDGNAASNAKPASRPAPKRTKPKPKEDAASVPPAPEAPATGSVIDRLREFNKEAGWNKARLSKELAFVLDLPKVDDIPKAMGSLTLDQAISLGEAMGKTAAEVVG